MNVIPLRTIPMTAGLLDSARQLASWHEDHGRSGSAIAIRSLVTEVENLREAAKGSLVVVTEACRRADLANFKASVLLLIAEKLAPVIDCDVEDWDALQALSDELHAAIKLAKG